MSILDRWNNFKRLGLLVCALLMWVMSIVFSYFGFKSDVRTDWYFGIFALILSATITILELYLNGQTFDFEGADVGMLALWVGGIAAYAYGIWTNIVGVSTMMLGSSDLTVVAWSSQVVPIIVGILLEVLPEPMFVAFLKSKVTRSQSKQQQAQFKTIPVPQKDHQRTHMQPASPHLDESVITRIRQTNPNPTYTKR